LPDIVAERYARLTALQERISLEKNVETIGATLELLVEGPSRKDPARVTARTRTNKIAHVPAETLETGTFVNARITGAHPHHLDGILV